VKARPLYVVGQTFGFGEEPVVATRALPTAQRPSGAPMTMAPTMPLEPVSPVAHAEDAVTEPTPAEPGEAKSRHELPKPTRSHV